MGAAQFLFPEGNEELLEHCSSYAQEGYRILVLAHSEQETKGTDARQDLNRWDCFSSLT